MCLIVPSVIYCLRYGVGNQIVGVLIYVFLTSVGTFFSSKFIASGSSYHSRLESPRARVDKTEVERKMVFATFIIPIGLGVFSIAGVLASNSASLDAYGWMMIALGGNLGFALERLHRFRAEARS
ncbi:hypothetical protein QWZ02_15565 [Kinneretia asaccharophila]|nr:hypothetical protein [Roseateles asaccharophilus]